MKKKIFIAAAIVCSYQCGAQDTSRVLQEVIFTANKTLQKQDQTGKVVSVITREDLEKLSGHTLAQVLNEQAGIAINGALNGLGSNQTLYMRGAAEGRTLVLLDGIPVYDPSFINSQFDLNFLMGNEIERIEILRGAQSTLYGSDAIAGAVNVITIPAAGNKKINARATLAAGNYKTFRQDVQVNGTVNKFSYVAGIGHLSSGGFSSAYDSTAKGNFDKDGYKGTNARASLQYQITSGLSLRGYVTKGKYKAEVDEGLFTDDKDYTITNTSLLTGANLRYNANGVGFTANYQYSESGREYLNDSLDVGGFAKYARDHFSGISRFAEVYATIKLGEHVTLLQGGDYRLASMNNQFLSVSSYGPYADNFKDTSLSQASVYASVSYASPGAHFNMEAGGRINVHSRYGNNESFTINPSYRLNKSLRIFGSVASSFKAPSLYELYSGSVGNRELKAERSVTWEAGIQQSAAKFNTRLVYFNRTSKDGLDFNYNTFRYFNFAEQKVAGLELEAAYQPCEKGTIRFNYTYLSPNEKTQSRKTFADTSYAHLLRRPAHSFNVLAGYQVTKKLFVSASGKYAGKRYDSGGYMEEDVTLDSYFIVGAHTAYAVSPQAKLFVDLQNITNKEFFDTRGYRSVPFLINGGLNLKF